jgi:hypothetical protein
MPEQHEKAYQLDKSEEVFDVVFRVALDKVEGFVKAQNTCAVGEHGDDRQRG